MIFNAHWHDNSRPDGFAVLEIVVKEGSQKRFIPLVKTDLHGTLAGPVADLAITHIFHYTREENPHAIEALYRFPLPGDAAITRVDVSFGKTSITTQLKDRQGAEADYEKAKKEQKAAVLLTRESPDVFTLRIAGIAPDEEVRITTRYVQAGNPEKTGFSFRIPLTTAPRYVRSDEQYSRHAHGQPLAVLLDPGHRFSLAVSSGGDGTIISPTHRLSVSDNGTVSLADGEVIPDRDCVLVWKPVQHGTMPACQVFCDGGAGAHFLALVSPPVKSPVHYPRDVIILVDHSGSMDGAKREAADWAVERFISRLAEHDTFNLCLFETRSYWLFPQPVQATPANRVMAVRLLQDTHSGGTELGVAMEQALSQDRSRGRVLRNLIVITDAEVTDTGRILRLVDGETKHKHPRRISMLCIDAAPNSYLARQVAERGGGIAKFLSSSPMDEDITSALDDILDFWEAPVATGLSLAVNRDNLFVDGRSVRKGPDGRCHIDIGDIPSGTSVWVVARAPQSPEPLAFELCDPDDPLPPVTVSAHPAVSALFGARLIAELEFLMHANYPEKKLHQCLSGLGYSLPHQKSGERVYAENRMQDSMGLIKSLVVRESLTYQVLSSETAFVAVRSEPGRPVEEQVIVPNALPEGWSDSFAGRGLMKSSNRQMVNRPAGGSVLEWVGGGGPMDMIMQPDNTMRMEARRVTPPVPASGTRILPKKVPSLPPAPITISPEQISHWYKLFSGKPVFTNNESVLFDSSRAEAEKMVPERVLLKKLEITVKGSHPATSQYLLLYVDDPGVPRVKVLLNDLLRHGGTRPLNIQRDRGELVKIVLVDPAGAWGENSPEIEVMVG